MLNLLSQNPFGFVIAIGVLLFSIAWHECGHALSADYLGDPTPRAQGRITLNPLKHIDFTGLLFIVFWGFGWGKAVQVDYYNLKRPYRDAALVALAGPVMSILLAVMGSLVLRFIPVFGFDGVVTYVISLNIMLAVFNLVPIYPLDGFHVVAGILSEEKRNEWLGLRKYGIFVLLLLLLPLGSARGPLQLFIDPVIQFVERLLLPGGII